MLKSFKKKMKDQAGLTLIELLVVIVILGIIAAVAIPMVMSQKDNAEANTDKQNLSVVQDAVNRYYTLNDSWPATSGTVNSANLVPKFLKELPKCADGGTATFKISGDGVVSSSCLAPEEDEEETE